MPIEENGHTSAYNEALRQIRAGLPEHFNFGKGFLEEEEAFKLANIQVAKPKEVAPNTNPIEIRVTGQHKFDGEQVTIVVDGLRYPAAYEPSTNTFLIYLYNTTSFNKIEAILYRKGADIQRVERVFKGVERVTDLSVNLPENNGDRKTAFYFDSFGDLDKKRSEGAKAGDPVFIESIIIDDSRRKPDFTKPIAEMLGFFVEYKKYDYDFIIAFCGIVCGEASTNYEEAMGVALVLRNRINKVNQKRQRASEPEITLDKNFYQGISRDGKDGDFDSITTNGSVVDNDVKKPNDKTRGANTFEYVAIKGLLASLERTADLEPKIRGALAALSNTNLSKKLGLIGNAYFWEGNANFIITPKTPSNKKEKIKENWFYKVLNAGILKIVAVIGKTSFFVYDETYDLLETAQHEGEINFKRGWP